MIAATAMIADKSDSLQIPTNWKELRAIGMSHSRLTPSLLTLSPFHIQIAIAQYLLRKYTYHAGHVTEVMSHLGFCELTNMASLRDFDWSDDLTLWVWGRYAMVRPHMDNATMREFIMADDYLTKYVAALEAHKADDAETNLYKLLATVCRPVNADAATSIKLNDRRVPLTGRDQVERIAAVLRRDAKSLTGGKIRYAAAVAVMTVLATKNFIAQNYMPHLTADEDGGGNGRSVNFGWHTVVMDIAENGAFGDMDVVYDSQLHDVMVFCVKKANDAAAAKAAADAQKINQ